MDAANVSNFATVDAASIPEKTNRVDFCYTYYLYFVLISYIYILIVIDIVAIPTVYNNAFMLYNTNYFSLIIYF